MKKEKQSIISNNKCKKSIYKTNAMQKKKLPRPTRHTESLTLFYTKDEASHTQTRTNKTQKEIKEKPSLVLVLAGPLA